MKIKNLILILFAFVVSFADYWISGKVTGDLFPYSPMGKFIIEFYGTDPSLYVGIETSISISDLGKYTYAVPNGQQGLTLTPIKNGYNFQPTSRDIGTVNDPYSNQDFLAIDIMAPTANVTAPTGSIVINVENTIRVTLEDNSGFVVEYKYYSTNNGSDYTLLGTVNATTQIEQMAWPTNNMSIKEWAFTPTILSDEYKIMVEVTDAGSKTGTGYSATFSVIDNTNPSVTLTSPNGSELWDITSTYNITWTATDNISIASKDIYYSINNGSDWIKLDNSSGNTGTWPWTIQSTPSNLCKVRVRAYDQSGNIGQDISDAVFEVQEIPDIINPVVSDITPVEGESIQRGSTYDITWTATDNKGVEKISIYLDTGSGYSELGSIDPIPETWSWSVPSTEHLNSTVRIYAYDAAGNQGEGLSGVFKIKDVDSIPPEISVFEPAKGRIVNGGMPISVRFYASDNFTLSWVSIYQSIDGESTYTISKSIAYSETDPMNIGIGSVDISTSFFDAYDQCKMKVILYDAEGNDSIGYSDSLFQIVDIYPPRISITPPPDTLESGADYNISWNAYDHVGVSYVLLLLSTNNGTIELDSICPDTDTGSYLWNVPQLNASNCYFKAQAFDAAGNDSIGISSLFSIVDNVVNVVNNIAIPKKFGIRITSHAIIIGMEKTAKVSIGIYALSGRKILGKTEVLSAGYHTIQRASAKGIYILRVKRADKELIKKIY